MIDSIQGDVRHEDQAPSGKLHENYFRNQDNVIPTLKATAAEQIEIVRQYQQDPSGENWERCCAVITGMIEKILQRFTFPSGVNKDDLRQEAYMTVKVAAENFDCEAGINWTTYAWRCLWNRLKRAHRDGHLRRGDPFQGGKHRNVKYRHHEGGELYRLGKTMQAISDKTPVQIGNFSAYSLGFVDPAPGPEEQVMQKEYDTQKAGLLETAKIAIEQACRARSKPEFVDRNIDIVVRIASGETHQSVADRHGLTKARVGQLTRQVLDDARNLASAILSREERPDDVARDAACYCVS